MKKPNQNRVKERLQSKQVQKGAANMTGPNREYVVGPLRRGNCQTTYSPDVRRLQVSLCPIMFHVYEEIGFNAIRALGHIKNFLFPFQRASLLESASRKILFSILLNLMYLALKSIVFR